MLAMLLNTPELAIEEAEAKRMETALKRVTKQYELPISQKHIDLIYFATTIGEVYGTRAVAIMARKRAETAQATSGTKTENVVNWPNVG